MVLDIYVNAYNGLNLYTYRVGYNDEFDNSVAQFHSAVIYGITRAIKSIAETNKNVEIIDIGEIKIYFWYGKKVWGFLISDEDNLALREKLKLLIAEFEKRYAKTLEDWNYNLTIFKGTKEIIESIFKDYKTRIYNPSKEQNPKDIHVLIIEDSEDDALLMLRELKRAGYNPISLRVDNKKDLQTAISKQTWDVILSDYSLPQLNGLDALLFIKERGLNTPFIFISGVIDETMATKFFQMGAKYFVHKNNLHQLAPIIKQEILKAKR